MKDKYIIEVDNSEVEIDKNSFLGKVKEFTDAHEAEMLKLFRDVEKAYTNNVKLDKFHYHEALHTANSMCEFIDISLVQHAVWESAPKEVKDYVVKAQEQLMLYYQWCAEEQDKLEYLKYFNEKLK